MKGWKTVAFNIVTLALVSPEVTALIPSKYGLYIFTIGNLILRAVTNTPIGRKK